MSDKMNTKIKCPVCGKMISENLGRKVHEKSKFHQDALKKQQGELKDDKDTVVKEHKEKVVEKKVEPEVKTEPVSGIKSGDTPPAEEKKGEGSKFLDFLKDDDYEDWWK